MNASSSSSSSSWYHESFHGHKFYHRIFIFVFLCCCLTNVTDSMPHDNNYNNGHRERGRRFQNFYKFMGFRFEIRTLSSDLHFDDDDVHSLGKKITMILKEMADESFCFGWAQQTLRGAVVGEVRCHEIAGYNFQKFLLKGGLETSILDRRSSRSSNSGGGTFPAMKLLETFIHVYKDTKIKLHFSHFKILDMDRNTCFRDEPHKCPDEDMVVTLL